MILFKLEPEEISYRTRILTIQFKKSNDIMIWHSWDFKTEEEMLNDFINCFLKDSDKILLGFNILKFDIPLLLLKSAKFQNFENFSRKLNQSNIIDLFVVLTFQRRGKIKGFNDYCKEIGIETIERDAIIRMYKNSEYAELDKAIKKNLNALEKLFESLVKKQE